MVVLGSQLWHHLFHLIQPGTNIQRSAQAFSQVRYVVPPYYTQHITSTLLSFLTFSCPSLQERSQAQNRSPNRTHTHSLHGYNPIRQPSSSSTGTRSRT
jgi:hypothetical protein